MEVRIEHLTKTFVGKKGSKTTAVNDMSFVVPDGKLVGLLGPSGCGKSTTLYMIAGLHKPTDGHIWFGDEDVTNVPPENRGIGLVFQNYALYPHFSVKQNITFPLDNVRFPSPLQAYKTRVNEAKSQIKKAQKAGDQEALALHEKELAEAEEALQKATEELEQIKVQDPERYAQLTKKKLTKEEKDEIAHKMARLVDIEPYLERKPKELSGGQQQRVAIARALVKHPRVLLLDEPLSNLDARLRLQTREEIRRIQQETGITSVFVTHDQEEAMSISDKIVVMKLGEMQQMGAPQEVYNSPANLFVAQFLGTPPINVFAGEVKGEKIYVGEDCVGDAKGIKDQKVSVAIRPEGFVLANEKDKDVLHAECEMIQVMGRDISVVAKNEFCTKPTFKAIISADDKVNPGKVALKVKPHKIFIFDSETDERIYIK